MKELSSEKLELIKRIDARISELEKSSKEWFKNASQYGDLVLRAKQEIDDLRLKREDIINGTNKYRIEHIELEILRLKIARDNANYLKRKKYDKAIHEHRKEIKKLKKE